MQEGREARYPASPTSDYCPKLVEIVIRRNFYSQDKERGNVRDVLFQDISVIGRIAPPSNLQGFDAGHTVKSVSFQNLRFGKRLIYGGHAISLARALSFNGLGNAFHVAAINGGRHIAPLFAGCTVFAWSEVLATADVPGRKDVGALRLRTIATKDRPCPDFPLKSGDDYDPAVILDLDYWVLMPK